MKFTDTTTTDSGRGLWFIFGSKGHCSDVKLETVEEPWRRRLGFFPEGLTCNVGSNFKASKENI
ncbi:hypothetical protein EYF80_017141 [Liparis tanakae]|uniref:Uncharacterized protein n=1 Tax=Liparis tanakae TaxID=230148 RepID=A0A4Z2I5Y3_9TELE|nr:hypothetical protein EYF80_017141 [Liparis tanakae]